MVPSVTPEVKKEAKRLLLSVGLSVVLAILKIALTNVEVALDSTESKA